MKVPVSMKELEIEATSAVEALFARIPAIKIDHIQHEPTIPDQHVDLFVHLHAFGQPRALVVELKRSGQPRFARMAASHLLKYIAHSEANAVPVFMAPYVSEESRKVCDEFGMGFIDLVGNAHLQFDGVYIDRTVAEKPESERRSLRSIFSPKASQIVRIMLQDPHRQWRVTELAEAADVSLGHVSNVRKALIDREWAEEFSNGVALTKPNALLDAWRENYNRPSGRQMTFYTHLHGEAFERAMRGTLNAHSANGKAILASFSAAQWLAPFARTSTHHFYTDELGAQRLQRSLMLTSTTKGENVVIRVMKDAGVFLDSITPAPGVVCTSKVQTYLDLWIAGERGREAADYLRGAMLQWSR